MKTRSRLAMTSAAAATSAAAIAGLLAYAPLASASTGGVDTRSAACDGGSSISLRVEDLDDSPQLLSSRVRIIGDVSEAKWTVKIYQDGDLTSKVWQRSDTNGSLWFKTTIAGDEDDRTKVTATAANGEQCDVGLTLGN